MDLRHCLFCRKVDEKYNLISINTSVDELSSDLASISLEVLNVAPMYDGLICAECRQQLIDSYKFKRKALEFFGPDARSKIIKNVHEFLNESKQLDDLTVMGFNTSLAIITNAEKAFFEYQGWADYGIDNSSADVDNDLDEFDELNDTPPEYNCEINIKEDRYFEQVMQVSSPDDLEHFGYEGSPGTSSNHKQVKRTRKPPPMWLKNMLNKCKKLSKTENGLVTVWNCCICENMTYKTYTGMKVHLVKSHLKEAMKCQPSPKRDSHHNNSSLSISLVESFEENGEAEKHKWDPEWIAEITIQSKDDEPDSWTCILCKNVSSKSDIGMKIHISRAHCESRRSASHVEKSSNGESSFGVDAENNSNEFEDEERHDKDLQWIQQKIDESRVADSIDVWKCCICRNVLSQSDFGMKVHIIRMHCKKPKDVVECEKYDRNPAWIEEMLNKSKDETSEEDSWHCVMCKNFSSQAQLGMKLHIIRMHCRKRKLEDDDDDGDDDYKRPGTARSSMNLKEKDWVDKMIEKSKTLQEDGCSHVWVCAICHNVKSDSSLGIKIHIVRMHRKDFNSILPDDTLASAKRIKQEPLDEDDQIPIEMNRTRNGSSSYHSPPMNSRSNRNEASKTSPAGNQTLLDRIRLSKVKTPDGVHYSCSSCGDSFASYQTIRYHILTRHLSKEETVEPKTEEQDEIYTEEGRTKCFKASEMSQAEKNWLKECMNKSRVKNELEDCWKCYFCSKLSMNNATMRYHLLATHFPVRRPVTEEPAKSDEPLGSVCVKEEFVPQEQDDDFYD